MRTSTIWPVLILALGAHAHAQAQARPSDAPPQQLDKIDDIKTADDRITVTPRKKNPQEERITEQRDATGRVTEAKVKSGPTSYTVRAPNTNSTTALPGDAAGSANRGPQWTVLEFDLGKKKTKQKEDEGSDDSPPPPKP